MRANADPGCDIPQSNMITTLGLRVVERGTERCAMQMPYTPAAQQPIGLFHSGAILALADTTATNLPALHPGPAARR